MDKAEYIDPLGESHSILYGWRYAFETKDFVYNNLYLNPRMVDPESISEGSIRINIWPGPGGDIGEGWTFVKDTNY